MLNKVILIGNVGGDPDIRSMPNGGKVANFSLATSEFWTDKNGERQSRTEWHKIVVYNENLIRLIEKAVHKGSRLYLEGMIKTRKYTSQTDGIERNITEIVLQGYDHTIKLLSPRPEGGEKSEHSAFNGETQKGQSETMEAESVDDDIPF